MPKSIGAAVCTFKREELSPTEVGIAVGEPGSYNVKAIVDLDGELVPTPVWNYQLRTEEGAFIARNIAK